MEELFELNMPTFLKELDKLIEYNETDEEKHFEMEGGDDHIIHTIRYLKGASLQFSVAQIDNRALDIFIGGSIGNWKDESFLMTIPRPENIDGLEGVPPGQYNINGVVNLLRENKENPEVIQFIADMMEN
jgi:hypothetical protein